MADQLIAIDVGNLHPERLKGEVGSHVDVDRPLVSVAHHDQAHQEAGMTYQQAFAQSIVDNIVNGNHTTARGQLQQCNVGAVLTVLELLTFQVNEDEINQHGTLFGAAIAKLRRVADPHTVWVK